MKALLGIGIFTAAVVAFYAALPRQGRVAPLLRRDFAQCAYMILIICMMLVGAINVFSGIAALDTSHLTSTPTVQAKR